MRVAAVTWRIEPAGSVDEFFAHAERLLFECGRSELIVFPELASLELLATKSDIAPVDVPPYLSDLLQPHFPRFGELSQRHGRTLVAGSHFARVESGIVNSAVVAFPDGSVFADVPKVVLTQYEANEWRATPGRGLRFLPDHRIGVTVCYDSEFPESGRAMAEHGVLVQCVPAFTESSHGFWRVRHCCQARAVENQVFVVHSSLVGGLGREPVPQSFGTSAVLAPCTPPFPANGLIAETPEGLESVAVADIDLESLELARASGEVRNWLDRGLADWTVSEAICLGSTKP